MTSPVARTWLEPGQRVNAAGPVSLVRRELDSAAVQRCTRIVVDASPTDP